jgi:hypothetical protein
MIDQSRKEYGFWEWFKRNNEKYLFLDRIEFSEKELLLNEFLSQLHKYCEHLYFQIGGVENNNTRELIISAEGNLNYFNDVENLVKASPEIRNWHVIAFKPPRGIDFFTNYEGLILDPRKMKFRPLANPKLPNLLGIQILLEDFNIENKSQIKLGIDQVLDSLLGEKERALNIHFLDVGPLIKDDLRKEFLDLNDLPTYIKWKKR